MKKNPPAKTKLDIIATPQHDDHTCGYRSACSVYKYYGLSPVEFELRDYLGTDHLLPFTVPFRAEIEEWMGGVDHFLSGTSPMDMFATLWWDGFELQVAKKTLTGYREQLQEHLALGHPALCLMHNIFHWVVINGYDESGYWIVDSIKWNDQMWEGGPKRRKFHMTYEEFHDLQRGILMVWRQEDAEIRDIKQRDFMRLYWQGLQFTAAAAGKSIPSFIPQRFKPPTRDDDWVDEFENVVFHYKYEGIKIVIVRDTWIYEYMRMGRKLRCQAAKLVLYIDGKEKGAMKIPPKPHHEGRLTSIMAITGTMGGSIGRGKRIDVTVTELGLTKKRQFVIKLNGKVIHEEIRKGGRF